MDPIVLWSTQKVHGFTVNDAERVIMRSTVLTQTCHRGGGDLYNENSVGDPFCYETDTVMFNTWQLLLLMVLVWERSKAMSVCQGTSQFEVNFVAFVV